MLLSCPLCCKPHFEGVDSLRATLVNVATAPLVCPVCHETLKGLDKLTIHLFGHVNINSKVSEENSDACHNSNCSDNIKEEIDKNISRICTSTVDDPIIQLTTNDILPDAKKSLPDKDVIITCDICSFTFTDKNILEMHQKLLHQTSPDEKTGKYSYHCHLCSKRFRMRGSLMVHLRVAHYGFNNHISLPSHLLDNKSPNEGPDNPNMDTDLINKGPAKPPDWKQWSCDVCAKMFTTKYFLKKHRRLHTGEMPYSCTICNKSFTFQQSYHKHMLYHSSEKPYVCNECGRAFKEHSTLQNHARIHSGERPFGCEICGKRFRQRVSYLVHMRIHTGVMPYKCTACQKSFRYKVSQRSHKCPMNPPGSVVRVSDSENNVVSPISSSNSHTETRPNESKCIMSVDYDTGNINLIHTNNNNDDGNNVTSKVTKIQENNRLGNSDGADIYSVVMSPILSEVESLCINNNHSPVGHPASPLEENIQIIREKCLEELFQ